MSHWPCEQHIVSSLSMDRTCWKAFASHIQAWSFSVCLVCCKCEMQLSSASSASIESPASESDLIVFFPKSNDQRPESAECVFELATSRLGHFSICLVCCKCEMQLSSANSASIETPASESDLFVFFFPKSNDQRPESAECVFELAISRLGIFSICLVCCKCELQLSSASGSIETPASESDLIVFFSSEQWSKARKCRMCLRTCWEAFASRIQAWSFFRLPGDLQMLIAVEHCQQYFCRNSIIWIWPDCVFFLQSNDQRPEHAECVCSLQCLKTVRSQSEPVSKTTIARDVSKPMRCYD